MCLDYAVAQRIKDFKKVLLAYCGYFSFRCVLCLAFAVAQRNNDFKTISLAYYVNFYLRHVRIRSSANF